MTRKLEKPVCIVGGVNREEQIKMMKTHCNILIATPGRLIDLVETENLTLRDVSTLIVDEADRMIDIGLVDQVMRIHKWCDRNDRHTVLLSASMPEKEADFIDTIVPKPREELYLEADTVRDVRVGISSHVNQTVHVCATHKKTKKLMKFIRKLNKEDSSKRNKTSILIFCNTKKTVGFVSTFLRKQNERVTALHGDMPQSVRSSSILDFKSGKKRVLVSTDVAARGIDIPRLEVVVNWDMPSRLEQYVHRVGRTGRNGASGRSFTFFTRNFAFLAPDLVKLLRRHNQMVDPNLLNLAENAPEIVVAAERKKKKRKRGGTENTSSDKNLSFKDRCWLAGTQAKKKSSEEAAAVDDDGNEKKTKKRRRGKRGGKKHSKSKKRIPI